LLEESLVFIRIAVGENQGDSAPAGPEAIVGGAVCAARPEPDLVAEGEVARRVERVVRSGTARKDGFEAAFDGQEADKVLGFISLLARLREVFDDLNVNNTNAAQMQTSEDKAERKGYAVEVGVTAFKASPRRGEDG
jgi:hypothetical protein